MVLTVIGLSPVLRALPPANPPLGMFPVGGVCLPHIVDESSFSLGFRAASFDTLILVSYQGRGRRFTTSRHTGGRPTDRDNSVSCFDWSTVAERYSR